MAATMLLLKSLLCVFTAGGFFMNFASSYDPMLTYTIRFTKITLEPNITGNYSINRYGGKQYVNVDAKIDSNKLIDNMVVVFHRCTTEGGDCEYFQSWKVKEICDRLLQKDQIWSSVYGAFEPPMECPIDKVYYKMKNGTFDLGPAFMIYPDAANYQWKVVQKFYSGDVFVGGYTVAASIFGYRKRITSILKG